MIFIKIVSVLWLIGKFKGFLGGVVGKLVFLFSVWKGCKYNLNKFHLIIIMMVLIKKKELLNFVKQDKNVI